MFDFSGITLNTLGGFIYTYIKYYETQSSSQYKKVRDVESGSDSNHKLHLMELVTEVIREGKHKEKAAIHHSHRVWWNRIYQNNCVLYILLILIVTLYSTALPSFSVSNRVILDMNANCDGSINPLKKVNQSLKICFYIESKSEQSLDCLGMNSLVSFSTSWENHGLNLRVTSHFFSILFELSPAIFMVMLSDQIFYWNTQSPFTSRWRRLPLP